MSICQLDGKETLYMGSITECKVKSQTLWKHNAGWAQERLKKQEHTS